MRWSQSNLRDVWSIYIFLTKYIYLITAINHTKGVLAINDRNCEKICEAYEATSLAYGVCNGDHLSGIFVLST